MVSEVSHPLASARPTNLPLARGAARLPGTRGLVLSPLLPWITEAGGHMPRGQASPAACCLLPVRGTDQKGSWEVGLPGSWGRGGGGGCRGWRDENGTWSGVKRLNLHRKRTPLPILQFCRPVQAPPAPRRSCRSAAARRSTRVQFSQERASLPLSFLYPSFHFPIPLPDQPFGSWWAARQSGRKRSLQRLTRW